MAGCVWMFCLVMAVVNLYAQDAATPLRPQASWFDTWVTPQNIVTAAVLIYGIGVLREQFNETRRQLRELREESDKFREEVIPATYARQDVTETRLRELRDRVEAVEKRRVSH